MEKFVTVWTSPICSILYLIAAYRADNPEAAIIFYICSGLYAISSGIQEYRRRKRARRGPRLNDVGGV